MNSLSNTTILVIDDDAAVRQTLIDLLEMNGFRTVFAVNGDDGLIAARSEAPSLIITDVSMPGMTGFELLEIFRADPELRTIPVIVISANVDRVTTRRGMELGAADFITKPFTEDEVIHSVATRLEKKDLLDELDAFAHTVAHDLKNPLCTLGGRIELATMMVGKSDDETLRNHLTEAVHSAHRLATIIEELLVLAGVRRQAVVPVPVDMGVIVSEAIDSLDGLLKHHAVQIEIPAAWPAAIGHAPWIAHVWVNYISNAVKYAGPGKIVLGAETSADGGIARFWVQDSGPGLDENARKKMFVPFTRLSDAKARGNGLGLSIVRRIIEKLGGKVGVESSPGAGSRFWFQLPTKPRGSSYSPFFVP
jgi:signal transduction histidine kinase